MCRKPKFAFVCDARNWAFDNIAQHVRDHLSVRYEVEIFYTHDYENMLCTLAEVFSQFAPERVHVFRREHLFSIFKNPDRTGPMFRQHRINTQQFGLSLAGAAVSISVHDHLNDTPEKIEQRLWAFQLVDGYSVCSPLLVDKYKKSLNVPSVCLTADGVDMDLFSPRNENRFLDNDRSLVVGWAGNSDWGKSIEDDNKGMHSIIVPAINKMQERGYSVHGHFADRVTRWRTMGEMVEYYNEIDILVCASRHEGTPDTILEAMACGVPVVTTNVGVVGSLNLHQSAGIVLNERSVDALQNVLSGLADDRQLLAQFASNARKCVEPSSWKNVMPGWDELNLIAETRHQSLKHFKKMLFRQYFTLAENNAS